MSATIDQTNASNVRLLLYFARARAFSQIWLMPQHRHVKSAHKKGRNPKKNTSETRHCCGTSETNALKTSETHEKKSDEKALAKIRRYNIWNRGILTSYLFLCVRHARLALTNLKLITFCDQIVLLLLTVLSFDISHISYSCVRRTHFPLFFPIQLSPSLSFCYFPFCHFNGIGFGWCGRCCCRRQCFCLT